jgi:hypothetical protein
MSHFHNQTNIERATSRKQQTNSPWFWFALAGGSIALHPLLISLIQNVSCCSRLQEISEATLPIDFVELPASVGSSSQPSRPLTNTASATPAPANNTALANNNLANSADIPQAVETGSSNKIVAIGSPSSQETRSTDVNSDTQSDANSNFVAPSASSAAEPPAPSTESEAAAIPPNSEIEESKSEVEQPLYSPTASPLAEQASPSQIAQPQSSSQLEIEHRPIPLPSPSPLIATQLIDVPVPDVSETLVAEADQNTATVTAEITVPSELTASLTTTTTETSDSSLDEVAVPKQEVQTFAANSTNSPCTVSPEAVPFLGKTVEMQVMTDESGQVVDTVTQESSQSIAYDELATCLVKNWEFEPAIAQGQPISTDGLVVRITIEADG